MCTPTLKWLQLMVYRMVDIEANEFDALAYFKHLFLSKNKVLNFISGIDFCYNIDWFTKSIQLF